MIDFKGETYNPSRDHDRLHKQLQRVFEVMRDGRWYTLQDIQNAIATRYGKLDPQPSISIRVRDLKNVLGHKTKKQCINGGLWRYRLIVKAEIPKYLWGDPGPFDNQPKTGML